MNKRFVQVEHTADIAIRVWGRDLAEMFVNAAYGMACQLVDPDDVPQTLKRTIELEADDAEVLLVTWLGELLYLGEQDDCIFTRFDMLEITPTHLRAAIQGGPAQEHLAHIKAVTFSELKIVQNDKGYETTVVFDV
jgi:SHS2 domain-containing protein